MRRAGAVRVVGCRKLVAFGHAVGRRHAEHADPVRCQLERHLLGHPAHGVLRADIGCETWGDTFEAGRRSNIDDDAAATGLSHAAGRFSGAREHASDIDVQYLIPKRIRHFQDLHAGENAGVVHPNVNAAQLFDRQFGCSSYR